MMLGACSVSGPVTVATPVRTRGRVSASASAQKYGEVVGGRRAERMELARREVLELTDKWMADQNRDRLSLRATSPALARAVETLVESNPGRVDARETLTRDGGAAWGGTWEVFHAPHLVKLSKLVAFWTGGTQVDHVRYVIGIPSPDASTSGVAIESSVFYTDAPFGPGTGWAVASGTVAPLPADVAEKTAEKTSPATAASSTLIHFDHFAMRDGEDVAEKSPLEAMDLDASAWRKKVDASEERNSWVSKLGTSFFFESLAVFPTRYLDEDLCVFEFPPLGNVQIACRRLKPTATRVSQFSQQEDGERADPTQE